MPIDFDKKKREPLYCMISEIRLSSAVKHSGHLQLGRPLTIRPTNYDEMRYGVLIWV
jgi:hypothetical protein